MSRPKVLFTVQGEGRGHMTQALAMQQILHEAGYDICGVLLGVSSHRTIPEYFKSGMQAPVIQFQSPNFKRDSKNKGIRILPSILSTLFRLPLYIRNMKMVNDEVKKLRPDLIINFYDPLIGLYNGLFRHGVPVISIAHQYVFHHPDFVFPEKDFYWEQRALKNFTSITSWGSARKLALSMYPLKDYPQSRVYIVPPLLRKGMLHLKPEPGSYLLVYLLNPGYMDEIIEWHARHPDQEIHCFTDRDDIEDTFQHSENLFFHKINDKKFMKLMAGARGFASTAGFESVCEAMYLGKPVFMVPVERHFEQYSNARDAVRAGAGIYGSSFDLDRFVAYLDEHEIDEASFRKWVRQSSRLILKNISEVLGEKAPGKVNAPVREEIAVE